MKISDLGSLSETTGLGYGYGYSTPADVRGLGYYGNSMSSLGYGEDDVLFGVNTIGQITSAQNGAQKAGDTTAGLMKAIIISSKQLDTAVTESNEAKIAAAKKDPLVAAKLRADAKQKMQTQTDTNSAIVATMRRAAREAAKALGFKKRAAASLRKADKQAAAAATIAYIKHSRNASILANKAEKTRVVTGAQKTTKALDAQAQILRSAAYQEQAASGASPSSMAKMAKASVLQQKSDNIKKGAAVVAAQPDVPPAAISQQREAELANKYNVRTALRDRFDSKKASTSVLSDIGDLALAQVDDYESTLRYYGLDLAGRLMADIDYGNYQSFIQGLQNLDGLAQAPATDPAAAAAAAAAGQQPAEKECAMMDIGCWLQKGQKVITDVSKMVSDGVAAATKGFTDVQKMIPGMAPKEAQPPDAKKVANITGGSGTAATQQQVTTAGGITLRDAAKTSAGTPTLPTQKPAESIKTAATAASAPSQQQMLAPMQKGAAAPMQTTAQQTKAGGGRVIKEQSTALPASKGPGLQPQGVARGGPTQAPPSGPPRQQTSTQPSMQQTIQQATQAAQQAAQNAGITSKDVAPKKEEEKAAGSTGMIVAVVAVALVAGFVLPKMRR